MAKVTSSYVCQQCGFRSSQYLGKCPECASWGSLVEEVQISDSKLKNERARTKLPEVVNLKDVEKEHYQRLNTGLGEFDRVLGGSASPEGGQGGGIVLGSIVLIAGDPGIGKSTLLTQLALNQGLGFTVQGSERTEKAKNPCLYVAGEESAQQIKLRTDRIKPNAELLVLNETDVDVITSVIEQQKPSLVIVDSIQTLETSDLSSAPGAVGQVRESAHRLQKLAKKTHIPIFIVGHVTKEGTVAGPRTLEHLVDVVLSLEGETSSQFRILRASKNRFGPTDEVGIFEMEESGMIEVKNPSELFIQQKVEAPGSVVVATLNGLRPIMVEIQALITKSSLPISRRTGSGIDNNRLQLIVAVLSKRLGLPLFDQDIFVNVTGGLKVLEPAVDLGIAMAIVSSYKDKTVPPKTVFMGEVGLLGELRAIRQVGKRITEAKKLGFTKIISPENAHSLAEAVKLALS